MKQARIIMDSGKEYLLIFEGDTNTFIDNLYKENISAVCDLKPVNKLSFISLKHISSIEIEAIR